MNKLSEIMFLNFSCIESEDSVGNKEEICGTVIDGTLLFFDSLS